MKVKTNMLLIVLVVLLIWWWSTRSGYSTVDSETTDFSFMIVDRERA